MRENLCATARRATPGCDGPRKTVKVRYLGLSNARVEQDFFEDFVSRVVTAVTFDTASLAL